MTHTYIEETEVAKMIRQTLKESFPAVKFSVKTHKYSGGSSIDVGWTNGPTREMVETKVGHFHGATFDGMQDLKEYHESELNGQKVRFANDFLFFNRRVSDDIVMRAFLAWNESHVEKLEMIGGAIYGDHNFWVEVRSKEY